MTTALGCTPADDVTRPSARPAWLPAAAHPLSAPPDPVLDGRVLLQERRQRGLSRERLAHQANVSVTTITRLERQDRAPCRFWTIGRLATALGLPPTALLPPTAPAAAVPALGSQ